MPDEVQQQLPMRLALRIEGDNWCAYCAQHDTMEGAVFLGAIRMVLVRNHPQRKHAFQKLMTEAMTDAIKHALGINEVTWNEPIKAPEHERSKS